MKCIICIEDLIPKNLVALECGHIYHTKCVIILIRKRTRKCPLCRKRITWNVNQLKRHDNLFV
jgi:hypothetical protein